MACFNRDDTADDTKQIPRITVKMVLQINGISYRTLGLAAISSAVSSYASDLGNAKAVIVIRDAKENTIAEVTEEYLENAKIATKAKDHKSIKKKSPRPIPSTLGPSSSSKFSFSPGDDIFPR